MVSFCDKQSQTYNLCDDDPAIDNHTMAPDVFPNALQVSVAYGASGNPLEAT